jgi:hypothetical protein
MNTATKLMAQNGSTSVEKVKLPTLQELIKEENYEQNALMVILNQPPVKDWIQSHPMIKVKDKEGKQVPLKYLSRERLEYLLTRIYGRWWVEVRDIKLIANAPVVTVRLYVKNPLTGEIEWNDGIGASPLQTDAGSGATNFDKIKHASVQMAAPAAETYAFKDAAEKFGKIFGKDLNVQDIDYTPLLKTQVDHSDLVELFDLKKDALTPNEYKDFERIIEEKEKASYAKAYRILQNK